MSSNFCRFRAFTIIFSMQTETNPVQIHNSKCIKPKCKGNMTIFPVSCIAANRGQVIELEYMNLVSGLDFFNLHAPPPDVWPITIVISIRHVTTGCK